MLCKHEQISKWQSVSQSSLAYWIEAHPLISSGLICLLSHWVETLSLSLSIPFSYTPSPACESFTHTYTHVSWSGWTSEWLLKGNVLTFEDYTARHFRFCSSLDCWSPPLDYSSTALGFTCHFKICFTALCFSMRASEAKKPAWPAFVCLHHACSHNRMSTWIISVLRTSGFEFSASYQLPPSDLTPRSTSSL